MRAAQRITRNSVHSYGPAVGRLDVRAEIAELVNRDGVRDYPGTSVRFLPDEVIFTPGTRSGLRKCVDYRLDAWPHPASKAEPAALTLAAIEAMIGLERLRGGKGA